LEVITLKKLVFLALSLLSLAIFIPGCVTSQPPAAQITPPVGQVPVISAFSSSPSAINPGGTQTLMWNVTGANSVSIDNGIGQVDIVGTRVISPASSTTYTLTATNSTGTATSSAVTTINAVAPLVERTLPVITEFSSYLNSDGSSTLIWNVIGADTVSINQNIGIVDASGTKVVAPAQGTTYILSADYAIGNWANEIGTVTKSVTVPAQITNTPWGL